MANFHDPLYSRIHGLAVGMLEGTLSDDERRELESLLLEDPAARRTYLEHMQESACLSWLCVDEMADGVHALAPAPAAKRGVGKWTRLRIGIAGLLASILVVVAAWQSIERRQSLDARGNSSDPTPIAKAHNEL